MSSSRNPSKNRQDRPSFTSSRGSEDYGSIFQSPRTLHYGTGTSSNVNTPNKDLDSRTISENNTPFMRTGNILDSQHSIGFEG